MIYPHPDKEWVNSLSEIKSITLRINDTGWLWFSANKVDIAVELLWAGGYAYGAYICNKGTEDVIQYLEDSSITTLRKLIENTLS